MPSVIRLFEEEGLFLSGNFWDSYDRETLELDKIDVSADIKSETANTCSQELHGLWGLGPAF